MRNEKVQKLVMTGVFAALSYVVFTFLQIKISLPGGDATSIHLGNAVCVLGALILGGLYGGVGGRCPAAARCPSTSATPSACWARCCSAASGAAWEAPSA